jgi:hypothetical protein
MELRFPLLIIVGLILLTAVAVAVYFLARGGGEKALEQSGVAARAKVLEIARTGVNRGPNTPLVRLRLEVSPPRGSTYLVEIEQGIHVMDLPRYEPGAEVAVRIDPRNPDHLVLVP